MNTEVKFAADIGSLRDTVLFKVMNKGWIGRITDGLDNWSVKGLMKFCVNNCRIICLRKNDPNFTCKTVSSELAIAAWEKAPVFMSKHAIL